MPLLFTYNKTRFSHDEAHIIHACDVITYLITYLNCAQNFYSFTSCKVLHVDQHELYVTITHPVGGN